MEKRKQPLRSGDDHMSKSKKPCLPASVGRQGFCIVERLAGYAGREGVGGRQEQDAFLLSIFRGPHAV